MPWMFFSFSMLTMSRTAAPMPCGAWEALTWIAILRLRLRLQLFTALCAAGRTKRCSECSGKLVQKIGFPNSLRKLRPVRVCSWVLVTGCIKTMILGRRSSNRWLTGSLRLREEIRYLILPWNLRGLPWRMNILSSASSTRMSIFILVLSTRRWDFRWRCFRCFLPSRVPPVGSLSGRKCLLIPSKRLHDHGRSIWGPRNEFMQRWNRGVRHNDPAGKGQTKERSPQVNQYVANSSSLAPTILAESFLRVLDLGPRLFTVRIIGSILFPLVGLL